MINITDSDITLENLQNKSDINEDIRKMVYNSDLILLPQYNHRDDVDRAFRPDTLPFYKNIKNNYRNKKILLFENPDEIRTLDLHSYDVWLPTIFINSPLYPFLINITSAYLYDLFKGREDESATIHFEMIIENNKKGTSKCISYNGPKESFVKVLENIDVEKLWSK